LGLRNPKKRPKDRTDSFPETDSQTWSGGDYFDPGSPDSVPREIARRRFLVLASELYGVTASLRDNVLPRFDPADPESIGSELARWHNRYHLGQRWVFNQVLDTLLLWKLFPEVSKLDQANPPWHPLFHLVKRRLRPETTIPFVFTHNNPAFEITKEGIREWLQAGGWDVQLERKENFVADARRQFEAALKSYCADQERGAAERGLIRVRRSRTSRIAPLVKTKWTVQRQCGQKRFEDIAQAHSNETGDDVDVSTITKAVNEQFELIGLDDEKP
jgi:hypothetical protein